MGVVWVLSEVALEHGALFLPEFVTSNSMNFFDVGFDDVNI